MLRIYAACNGAAVRCGSHRTSRGSVLSGLPRSEYSPDELVRSESKVSSHDKHRTPRSSTAGQAYGKLMNPRPGGEVQQRRREHETVRLTIVEP